MDGGTPTYDDLLDLTRRQARHIDELRAEVERLKAELEQVRRAGKRQTARAHSATGLRRRIRNPKRRSWRKLCIEFVIRNAAR